jgi:Flp pilus assembly protein CpaB
MHKSSYHKDIDLDPESVWGSFPVGESVFQSKTSGSGEDLGALLREQGSRERISTLFLSTFGE